MSFVRMVEHSSPIEIPEGQLQFVRIDQFLALSSPGERNLSPETLAKRFDLSFLYQHLRWAKIDQTDHGLLLSKPEVVLVFGGVVDEDLEQIVKDDCRLPTLEILNRRLRHRPALGDLTELTALASREQMGYMNYR